MRMQEVRLGRTGGVGGALAGAGLTRSGAPRDQPFDLTDGRISSPELRTICEGCGKLQHVCDFLGGVDAKAATPAAGCPLQSRTFVSFLPPGPDPEYDPDVDPWPWDGGLQSW